MLSSDGNPHNMSINHWLFLFFFLDVRIREKVDSRQRLNKGGFTMKKRIGLYMMSLGFVLALSQVASAGMTFRNLTKEHVKNLVGEFTADMYHNSVTPTSRPTIK